ncbi:MAG: OmpA family protein [Deltaproteobacteria bacterium]|nr:OmpA family protein [Deltaproteobacteria bacterium]MBW2393062.1 OmpA family protein [Deltaproteobacteria bacterium]
MSRPDSPVSFWLALLLALSLPVLACQTTTGTALDKKSTQGAIAGAVLGAAAGAAIDGHKRGRGAVIGAAVGGLAGGLIGHTLDRQAQEIDVIPDAQVERRDDRLFVAFPNDVMFDTGSHALYPGAYSRLDQLVDSLLRYPDTEVVVKGHTDSTGNRDSNLSLSEDRADAVRRYLIARGISPSRVTAIGFGDAMPLATNQTQAGRLRNRRVEIEIRPTRELRERDRQQREAQESYTPAGDDRYDPYESSAPTDAGSNGDPYEPGDADRYDDPYEVR